MQTKITKFDGTRQFLMTIIGRAYPRVVGALRDLNWVFFDTFLPLLTSAGYVYVYRSLGAPQEYVGFVIFGGAMLAFWMNILWTMSSQLYWEKETGNLALYVASPTSMMAILLGMAIGGLLATTLRASMILVIGSWLLDVQYVVMDPWLLFAVFLLTMVALYGMGMMMASLFLLFNREAWHLANLIQAPTMLFSGFYFPVKVFGFWPAMISSLIPLTLGLDAMRQLAFPSGASLGFLSVQAEVGILALLSVLYVDGSYFVLKYMEGRAVRYGKITDRLS